MARIFISHSSRDVEQSERLIAWLRAQGFEHTFLDFDKHAGIPPGAEWEKRLYREISRAEAMLLVLTKNWLDSKWCFAEFTQARALGKAIFPLIETPKGETFIAPDIQSLDLTNEREGGLEQLCRELTRLALNAQGEFPWDSTRAPYPGLLAFDEADAAVYFGRDDDIRRLIERLNARRAQGGARLIALLAGSGSGKSSLMRAGLLPRLKRDRRNWLVLPPFRPQTHPVDELAQAVAQALGPSGDWRKVRDLFSAANLSQSLRDLARDLRAVHAANNAQILVSIDQGEELFGTAEPAESEKFWTVLAALLDERLPFIGLLAMRSDFLDRLQQASGSVPFEEFSLKPLPLERWRDIIEGPARVAGCDVEHALTATVIKDAATDDALPLLAFALRELYERFGKSGGLTVESYRALGDERAGISPLENAVRRKADDVLAEAKPGKDELQALKDAFVPAMVRVDAEGEFVRQPARIDALPAAARPLVDRLAGPNARLLVLRQEGATRVVEVAHEALLRKWPRLRGWLDEEREFLSGRQQLEQDLVDWQKATDDQRSDALLTGLKLTRARDWLATHRRHLSEAECSFIEASIARQEAETMRRERTRRRVLMASLAASIVLLIAAGTAVWQWLETARERDRTAAAKALGDKQLAVQSNVLANFSRQSATAGDFTTAMLLALEALPDSARKIERPYVDAAYTALIDSLTVRRELLVFGGALQRTADPRFVSRDSRILTKEYEGPVVLWDAATGAEVLRSPPPDKRYRRAETSPDGSRLVIWSESPLAASLWDTRSGRKLVDFSGPMSRATSLTFSPDSDFVVAAGDEGVIQFWSAGTGDAGRRIETPPGRTSPVFNAEGTRIAASIGRDIYLWDVGTGRRIAQIAIEPDPGLNQGLYGSGSSLGPIVAGTRGNDVMLFDSRTGSRGATLTGHTAPVRSLRPSPNGQHVITASDDGTARIWRIDTGERVGLIQDREYPLMMAYFDPTGTRIVTVGGTKFGDRVIQHSIARLWNAADLSLIATLQVPEHRLWGDPEFSKDGSRLLVHHEITSSNRSEGRNYTHTLWNAKTGTMLTSNGDFPFPKFSHDTRLLLRADGNVARVLDVNDAKEIAVLGGHSRKVVHAAFSSDDTRVVTSSDDGTARVWSIRNRADAQAVLGGVSKLITEQTTDPNRVLIVTGDTQRPRLHLWDFATRSIRRTIDLSSRSAIVTSDHRLVAAATDDNRIRILKSDDLSEIAALGPFDGNFSLLTSDATGRKLMVRFGDDIVRVFDIASRGEIATFRSRGARFGSLAPNADYVSTISRSNVIQIWAASGDTPVGTIQESADVKEVITLNPSRVVIVAQDGTARLWNAGQSRKIGDLGKHVASSPDARLLVAVTDKAQLWDISRGRVVAHLGLEKNVHVFFFPDGRFVTLDQHDELPQDKRAVMKVWNSSNGALIRTLFEGPLVSYVFGLQEQFFTAEFNERTIGWNMDTLQQHFSIGGKVIAISPDRQSLLMQLPKTEELFVVRLFARPQAAIDHVVESISRCLTRVQREAFFLEADPPSWCVEMGKWPYHRPEWKQWLTDRKAGRRVEMPAE